MTTQERLERAATMFGHSTTAVAGRLTFEAEIADGGGDLRELRDAAIAFYRALPSQKLARIRRYK